MSAHDHTPRKGELILALTFTGREQAETRRRYYQLPGRITRVFQRSVTADRVSIELWVLIVRRRPGDIAFDKGEPSI